METCILCHRFSDVSKDQPINERKYYVEGAGQLCPECYRNLYM